MAGGVSSGALEFGKSSMTTLFEAHERGIPFTLATPSALYDSKSPYLAFMVAKDGPIHSGKDMNNQLVSVAALGDIGTIAMPAWIEQHGGDPKAVRYVHVQTSVSFGPFGCHTRSVCRPVSQEKFGKIVALPKL